MLSIFERTNLERANNKKKQKIILINYAGIRNC
jgi:hypothetical protein